MIFDRYVLALFLKSCASMFSRLLIGLNCGDVILTFFLAIFMLNKIPMMKDGLLSLQSVGSNVTTPHSEIGASFQQ